MPNRWNNVAKIRRHQIESGSDLTFNKVFRPLIIKCIQSLSPKNILEVGAGTGHLSKDLSNLGLTVTAIEPSLGMYEVARDVLSPTDVKLINCTSLELGKDIIYDIAFSHLVAHVVDDLTVFFESIGQHLDRGGYFIFSIPHPCFYNEYKNFLGDDYNYMIQMKKNVSFTITKDSENIISGVPYHHRPLSEYFNKLVATGFSIYGFDEIYPSDEIQAMYGTKWESPRYCVFTCKKL
ncbi:class I SAM-dependent methyltransferase [Pectobacterium parvum]|uniref:Methyltransferase domain-containing protein n=1 Tax=Pectobacterium parvum TaxID=2778550 RepID=A0AAP9LBV2_9GAMM|nr:MULTISPECIES: class I SAM-dependent methyltransferase [Pectobacterium]KHT26423.1 methyltransferase type 11 [Pectobacterium carotovorum subsp. carotovorum]QHQ23652.1 methyltransferase domain-containing protein [Pectobacterium parvum]UFK39255.1 class I SAM-dependent methyltransferase [Pectobacterium parvum]